MMKTKGAQSRRSLSWFLAALACGITGFGFVAAKIAFSSPDILGHSIKAKQLFVKGDRVSAASKAAAALRLAPLDQRSLTIYALTIGENSKAASAAGAMAGLGWRNIGAQVLLAEAGLQSRNEDLVRQRLTALLAKGASASIVNPLLDKAIAGPMRTAAVGALSHSPGQGAIWADRERGPEALLALAEVLKELRDVQNSQRYQTPANILFHRLRDAGLDDAAFNLAVAYGNDGASGRLSIPLDDTSYPYTWRVPDSSAAYLSRGPGERIVIEKSAPFATLALRYELPPYVRRVTIDHEYADARSDRLSFFIRCRRGRPRPLDIARRREIISISADCRRATIEIRLPSAAGRVELNRLRLSFAA